MRRALSLLGAVLLVGLSGFMTWAAVNDYQSRSIVPPGVTVAGHDLAGMTLADARQAIDGAVSTPMLRPLTVTGDGKSWTLEARGIVSVDDDAMIADAYSTWRSATFVQRLSSELLHTPLTHDVKPEYSVDASAIASWVASASPSIDRKPVDAVRKVVNYNFKITPSALGKKVDGSGSESAIAKAFTADAALSDAGDRTAPLIIQDLKPKVVESSFGRAIIVSLSDKRIFLFNGDKVVKSYPCAPGRPSWPTPTGDFKIISKDKNAPWYNPGSSWAASMPPVIAGGPYNPMGDTKIGIDYPGVYMHSTPPSEWDSIGGFASHGCMRMLPHDAHDLYDRVKIGDPVFIRH